MPCENTLVQTDDDPLIFAIETYRAVGPDELQHAIIYRLAIIERLRREISTLEHVREEHLHHVARFVVASPRLSHTRARDES